MKFKPMYKCQRCGLIYVDDDIRDSDDDENFNAIQKHHCGQNKYGAADIIGYKLMDEEAEASPAGKSRLEKQYDYLKFQTDFLQQIKSVSESAKG